mgnify:CR=1 FL=1
MQQEVHGLHLPDKFPVLSEENELLSHSIGNAVIYGNRTNQL